MASVRWAFNFRKWLPGKEDWKLCLSLIQSEEKDRISKFLFKKDAKASLAGRLMIRKVVCETLGIPWADVKLWRTDKGRPYHLNTSPETSLNLNFNVSHQGEWVILAAETSEVEVGADVMRVEDPSSKNVPEYFRLMNRQFTEEEWLFIRGCATEREQLKSFYRNWCLKEAFVKALGVGISYNLQSISFVPVEELSEDHIIKSTKVKVQGKIDPEWQFEEYLLDENHIATVALHGAAAAAGDLQFKTLAYGDLIASSQCVTGPDDELAESVFLKDETPWG